MAALYSARRASEQLNVLVVGNDISALATAYALQRAGHSCTVLDPNPAGQQVQGEGGILVSPNASGLLAAWGIAQDLLHDAIPLQQFTFASHTEQSSARCPFDSELLQDPTATFVFSEHAALVDRLRHQAISAGAKILHDHHVVGVSAETCQVTLADGKSLKGDLLVGADGSNSIVRRSLFPTPSVKNRKTLVCASTTIPKSHLDQHPSTKDLSNRQSLSIWANNDCLATAQPVQNGDALALTLYYPPRSGTDEESPDSAWNRSALAPEIRGIFSGWGATLSTLLTAVDSAWTSVISESSPLEVFHFPPDEEEESTPHGFAVLVGDAAHALAPGILYLSSILEDAAVLGSLFSRYDPTSPPTDVWTLISAYTSIRLDRKTKASLDELRSLFNAVLPDGVEPVAQSNTDSDDDPVAAKVWEQYAADWSYDAFEDAEEWWALWKLPADRSEAALSAAGSDSDDTAEPAALSGDLTGKLLDPVEIKRRSRVGSVSVDISVSVVRGS